MRPALCQPLLTLRMSVASPCCGSWILSASCPLVPTLFLLLCARFLPAMSFWLGHLLLMRQCLLVNVCFLLAWYKVAHALSRCRPHPVLTGVAPPPPSAPSRVPRPKPSWGKAWSLICFFLFSFGHHTSGIVSRVELCISVMRLFAVHMTHRCHW
jgi:hypothetical protein